MNRLSFFYAILLLLLVVYYFSYDISGISYCIYSLIIVTVAVFLNICNQQTTKLRDCWIKPSNLLLLGLLIVNFQYVLDLVLGYKPYSFFKSPNIVNECCGLATIGIISFLLGNVINYKVLKKTYGSMQPLSLHLLYVLQLAFFIGWIVTVDVVSLVTGLSYGNDGWGGGIAAFFEDMFYGSVIAVLITQVINNNICLHGKTFFKSFPLLFWILVCLYLTIRLLSGDRGPFIYTLLAITYAYFFLSKLKVKLKYVFVSVFAFALLLTMVGMARSMTTFSFADRMSSAWQNIGKARFSDNTVFFPTEELAMSFRCNETAISEINGGASYHNGKYQLYHILNYIPFMPSFLYSNLKIPITELSSDYYLTEALMGDYRSTQIGTTVLADFYLDLGVFGVIIGFFFMGLFFRYVDYNIFVLRSTNFWSIAIAITYASQAIYIPRSTFLSPLKGIVIITVLYYLNKTFSKK